MMNIEQSIRKAMRKTKRSMERFTGEMVPVVTVNGTYDARMEHFDDMNHWTFSFFTGTVLHAFHHSGDLDDLRYVYGFAEMYRRKVFDRPVETMHDLGFLYSLYAVMLYRTTGDPEMRKMALRAADVLAMRFLPGLGVIQSWDRMTELDRRGHATMIVDTMMNLPLLFWAWRETGHVHYKQVAEAQADSTIRHLLRADGSIYHSYDFKVADGAAEGPRSYCGYAVESAWSRGTAWAIYGFVLAHRYTGRADYEQTAIRLADFYLSQLPEDGIPVWDFRLPADRPHARDTSAAAIVACALLELVEIDGDKYGKYREHALRMIESLSTPYYLTDHDEIESILVNFPDGTFTPEELAAYELDNGGFAEVGSVFGDYFYMEALMRLSGKVTLGW